MSRRWKLWLDDVRDPPDATWRVARTSRQALALVREHGAPWRMSLDHDLGLVKVLPDGREVRTSVDRAEHEDNAMIFLKELASMLVSPPKWEVHSSNPPARESMEAFLKSWENTVRTGVLVFVYGSLMRGMHNHRILIRSEFVTEAKTRPAFRLVDMGAFPGMVIGDEPVKGEIFRVPLDVLDSLDMLEGHPHFYKRQEIVVESSGGELVAWAYVLPHSSLSRHRGGLITGGDWRAHVESRNTERQEDES